MPLHPLLTENLHLLDGVRSFADAEHDPEILGRVLAYHRATSVVEPPAVPSRMEYAPGPHGPVPVRVYEPEEHGTGRPCLVWLHGGGFVAGDLDIAEADWVAREIVTRAGAVVVSVDYRLAVGEVSYPVPLDDVVAAVRWARDRAAGLGTDPAATALGGASAGANLAAGAALRLRDEDAWLPARLVVAYPLLHADLPPASPALIRLMTQAPPIARFTPEDIEGCVVNYLGGPPSGADGYAMPGHAALAGLCPTLVLNAEYDDLRPSGESFTAALALAGVDVRQLTVPGVLHGFLHHGAGLPPVDAALDVIATVVGDARSGPAAKR
ncbi:alpha/beta hydrolase [Streptomyces specialis]|uniref:alpha/beta hydrolase n=1 Tax=Streptomyces specialis TaxID=498367 RepID=UPI00073EBE42|nr:alpha/beta hydrolase fold domain-containing protein [Streptomyces specialis]